jgi:mannose-6-phosphate isomerase
MDRLTGVIQPYAWGSRTAIPEFLGVPPTGEPQAELWFGAHPLAPSLVDGEPLDKIIADDPVDVVGEESVLAFGPRLPFLLKVIAAAQPLSLQAHPSRAEAEAGFDSEQAAGIPRDAPNRTYRDGWPKPEVLCALVETEALCGLPGAERDLSAVREARCGQRS